MKSFSILVVALALASKAQAYSVVASNLQQAEDQPEVKQGDWVMGAEYSLASRSESGIQIGLPAKRLLH